MVPSSPFVIATTQPAETLLTGMNNSSENTSPLDTPINLHVGGQQAKVGWKILDAIARPEVDFIGDIRNLGSLPDQSCAQVYCSHVLEHVGQRDLVPTLKGIHRILQSGGKLYISVPDLGVLCNLFLQPRLDPAQRFHVMRMMFGGQTDDFDLHKIGLNAEFLADYLYQAGFYSMEQVENFGLFDDTSSYVSYGVPISLNVIAIK